MVSMIKKKRLAHQVLAKFFEPTGLYFTDKLVIAFSRLLYFSFRIGLRLLIGKQRRDELIIRRKLFFERFLLCPVRVEYCGYRVLSRNKAADLSLLSPSHETSVSNIVARTLEASDTFVIVGANVGRYALLGSSIITTGRIIAIEPDPSNFRTLTTNMRLNNLNVECINVAISHSEGYATLYQGYDTGQHSLLPNTARQRKIEVKTEVLDSLIRRLGIKKIKLLLVDIEGMEYSVLKRSSCTLQLCDNVIIEVHSDDSKQSSLQLLKNNGFIVEEVPPNHLLAFNTSKEA